jgi:hypothetical protein
MSGKCCNPKKGLTHDSSMSLLLNVVAARTKIPRDNDGNCCTNNTNVVCSCNGNASPLNNTNIYRNKQITQIIQNCRFKNC